MYFTEPESSEVALVCIDCKRKILSIQDAPLSIAKLDRGSACLFISNEGSAYEGNAFALCICDKCIRKGICNKSIKKLGGISIEEKIYDF